MLHVPSHFAHLPSKPGTDHSLVHDMIQNLSSSLHPYRRYMHAHPDCCVEGTSRFDTQLPTDASRKQQLHPSSFMCCPQSTTAACTNKPVQTAPHSTTQLCTPPQAGYSTAHNRVSRPTSTHNTLIAQPCNGGPSSTKTKPPPQCP